MKNGLALALMLIGGLSLRAATPAIEMERSAADDSLAATIRMMIDGAGGDRILAPGGPTIRIGIHGGANESLHDGSFLTTENGIACCTFDGGSGLGVVMGARAFIPLSERVEVSVRASYETTPGTFRETGEPLPFFGEGNRIETIRFDEELSVSIASAVIDVMGSYDLTDGGLYGTVGASTRLLLSQSFAKRETIPGPSGVTFLDGTTSRIVAEGTMDDMRSVGMAIRGGLGMRLPIAEGLWLNPEALYTHPISSVKTTDDWSTGTVQLTLGLLFGL